MSHLQVDFFSKVKYTIINATVTLTFEISHNMYKNLR